MQEDIAGHTQIGAAFMFEPVCLRAFERTPILCIEQRSCPHINVAARRLYTRCGFVLGWFADDL